MFQNSPTFWFIPGLLFALFLNQLISPIDSMCIETLEVLQSQEEIVIDGRPTEKSWTLAKSLTTYDMIAEIEIQLKALYDKNHIYLLVKFPDETENRIHKSWVWDKTAQLYSTGWDREDIFVIKWFLEFDVDNPKGFSIYGNTPHKADIWYWKANRTDPMGFADDKLQVLSSVKSKRATQIKNDDGQVLYLLRKGDAGEAAYSTTLAIDYQGDKLQRFVNTPPSGSRADVQAKGLWKEGKWTIEFKRALNTSNKDDILFSIKDSYLFGVSRFEIAGRSVDQRSEQPLYGTGDISTLIQLQFSSE